MGDNTNIAVRAISRADEPLWRQMWSAYLRFYASRIAEEVTQTTFARLVSDDGPQFGFIAARDGLPVGFVHFLFHRHNWMIEDVCYLQDLYAAPEVRGAGVGRALIEAVYAEADARGAPSVYWMTQSDNTMARRLYDRIGTLTPFIKYQRGA